MVLVHHDAVVVLATGVTAAAGMLAVLADTAMAGADVAALLAVLAKACCVVRVARGCVCALASASSEAASDCRKPSRGGVCAVCGRLRAAMCCLLLSCVLRLYLSPACWPGKARFCLSKLWRARGAAAHTARWAALPTRLPCHWPGAVIARSLAP